MNVFYLTFKFTFAFYQLARENIIKFHKYLHMFKQHNQQCIQTLYLYSNLLVFAKYVLLKSLSELSHLYMFCNYFLIFSRLFSMDFERNLWWIVMLMNLNCYCRCFFALKSRSFSAVMMRNCWISRLTPLPFPFLRTFGHGQKFNFWILSKKRLAFRNFNSHLVFVLSCNKIISVSY